MAPPTPFLTADRKWKTIVGAPVCVGGIGIGDVGESASAAATQNSFVSHVPPEFLTIDFEKQTTTEICQRIKASRETEKDGGRGTGDVGGDGGGGGGGGGGEDRSNDEDEPKPSDIAAEETLAKKSASTAEKPAETKTLSSTTDANDSTTHFEHAAEVCVCV